MSILEPAPEGYCNSVQDVEDRIISAFSKAADYDPRFISACARLKHYSIEVSQTRSWRDIEGVEVIGQTYCAEKTMVVNPVAPGDGSLAHECAHAVQDCTPLPPFNPRNYYHSNWVRIYDALYSQGLPE